VVAEAPRNAFYNRSASTSSHAVDVPQLALPKGGGALRGIDKKFSVNVANGTASLSLPLPLTPSRALQKTQACCP
jgi:hypothetical protein